MTIDPHAFDARVTPHESGRGVTLDSPGRDGELFVDWELVPDLVMKLSGAWKNHKEA